MHFYLIAYDINRPKEPGLYRCIIDTIEDPKKFKSYYPLQKSVWMVATKRASSKKVLDVLISSCTLDNNDRLIVSPLNEDETWFYGYHNVKFRGETVFEWMERYSV